MAIPEGHVERVCLRNDSMCPRLAIFIDVTQKTRRFECMKSGEDRGFELIKSMFGHDPELVHALSEGAPKGNCSGTPAYFEYPPED